MGSKQVASSPTPPIHSDTRRAYWRIVRLRLGQRRLVNKNSPHLLFAVFRRGAWDPRGRLWNHVGFRAKRTSSASISKRAVAFEPERTSILVRDQDRFDPDDV